jgi:hypothetical protein
MAAFGDYAFNDYRARYTIMFGKLLDQGWDWGRETWTCGADMDRDRLNDLIEQHYWLREICQTPPKAFALFLVRKLNEVSAKYEELYRALKQEQQEANLLANLKERTVDSSYPQMQLSGNEDYASTGQDKVAVNGGAVQLLAEIASKMVSLDQQFLDELEPCFIHLTSSNDFNLL